MAQKKQKCSSCNKEFSINTLAKYDGICGKCNSKLKKEAIKKAPSLGQSIYTFGLAVIITLIFSWGLYQVFPDLNNTNKKVQYIGDREFVDNEYISQEEISLFKEIQAKPRKEIEQKRKGYVELIQLNPYKPLYRKKLAEYSKPDEAKIESITKEEVKKINKFLDSVFLENIETATIKSKLVSKYPLLGSYQEDIDILSKRTVYLFYENLPSGGLWDKPGAKNFGGKRVGTVSFAKGPVKAECVAHKSLEGGRNYFYVVLQNGDQGWMGRPYVMKDKRGSEFLMPNPLTGEKVRIELKVDRDFLTADVRANTERYIPSYDSIDWDNRIPARYRQEGYSMYRQAMLDGYAEVDRLVSQYQGF